MPEVKDRYTSGSDDNEGPTLEDLEKLPQLEIVEEHEPAIPEISPDITSLTKEQIEEILGQGWKRGPDGKLPN